MPAASLEDTARLVLMDLSSRSGGAFVRETRDYHPEASLDDLQYIWEKYMGLDGRSQPTHDLQTGNRLK